MGGGGGAQRQRQRQIGVQTYRQNGRQRQRQTQREIGVQTDIQTKGGQRQTQREIGVQTTELYTNWRAPRGIAEKGLMRERDGTVPPLQTPSFPERSAQRPTLVFVNMVFCSAYGCANRQSVELRLTKGITFHK